MFARKARVFAIAVGSTVVAGSAVAPASAATAAPARPGDALPGIGALLRSDPGRALPASGGTVQSLNWSGYAVKRSAAPINGISASFTVPAAGLLPPGFAATWAGIGGYDTGDLIQAGVAEDSLPGTPLSGPQYYPWYELLPKSEMQLVGCTGDRTCAISPGDRVSVRIKHVGARRWSITVADGGNWLWAKTVAYASSRSSAEWILEAPSLLAVPTPLAPVGTVHFGWPSTYTAGSRTHRIAAGDPAQINLGVGPLTLATPSALGSDRSTFNACAYARTCPAP
jgi:hypothetical protein